MDSIWIDDTYCDSHLECHKILQQDPHHGQRLRGEPRGAPVGDPDVELEGGLRLVVEGGDGPDGARALVDGEEAAGVLLQDLSKNYRT